MSPDVPQCKNCWKWGHLMFSCRIQGFKYVKCNGPHKSENHCEFGWYCKASEKSNPPWLEMKKGESCLHTFKCSNCQGNHQANSNLCLFWRHRFNKEWQQKKYAKICENRVKSIRSIVRGGPQQWSYKTSGSFHKMFKKTHSSSTLFSKLKSNSISSSSKNLLGPKSVKSLAHKIAKAKL